MMICYYPADAYGLVSFEWISEQPGLNHWGELIGAVAGLQRSAFPRLRGGLYLYHFAMLGRQVAQGMKLFPPALFGLE